MQQATSCFRCRRLEHQVLVTAVQMQRLQLASASE